jgi:3-hydroxyisobutyrate dehydrogenase-like beta-hydroxyacid dehydrogenase
MTAPAEPAGPPAAGIIGCGHMGGAIAARWIDAGHRLHVCDIRPAAAEKLAARGAAVSPDPAALAAACDAVLLSLPSHVEVDEVCSGGGVLGSLRPGRTLINLTTGSHRQLPGLAEAARARGIHYVTSPVSQAVDGATAGRLTAFTAGTEQAHRAAVPVLAEFCAAVLHFGEDHRAAMAAKIVTNLSWFINAAALGDLMPLAVRAGIPRERFREMMGASCGASWVADHDVPSILDGTYDETFTLGLAVKDLRLAFDLADDLGVPLEIAAAARAVFLRALARYGPDAPELIPVRIAAERAGVRLGQQPPVPAAGLLVRLAPRPGPCELEISDPYGGPGWRATQQQTPTRRRPVS